MNSLLLQYWGKAQPKPEPGDAAALVPWHPLVYHSLDVAAVGQVLLWTNDRLGRLFDRLELDGSETEALFCLLLALHDLGKFSKPFQAKAPQFYPTVLGELPSLPDPGHSRASHLLWDSALSDVSETIANDACAVHARSGSLRFRANELRRETRLKRLRSTSRNWAVLRSGDEHTSRMAGQVS